MFKLTNAAVPPYARLITPCSMNLNDPLDFTAKLAATVLFWEIPRALTSFIVRKTYGKAETEKEKGFVHVAPAYVMSTVHALAVASAGLRIGWVMLSIRLPRDRYYYNSSTLFKLSDMKFTEIGNWLFCGYMFGDLLHLLWEYPRLGKVDMVAHHACFIACSLLAGHSQTMMLPFSWLLLGEFSTPILCLRWLIQQMTYELKSERVVRWARALGYKGEAVSSVKNAGKQLEFVTSVGFMATFFIVRILCYTSGFFNMLYNWHTGVLDPIPKSVTNTLLVLVSCGAGLNWYWFSLMVKKAMRGPPKPEAKKED